MYQKIKSFLFKIDPENAHHILENLLLLAQNIPMLLEYIAQNLCVLDSRLEQNIYGINFYNPIGLGAGFDKNATMIRGLSAIGLGFIEIGTVTNKMQDGNPKPRLYRFPQERSLQNHMGFNNDGAQKILQRISKIFPYIIPIGINMGKNKNTEEEAAIVDYEKLINYFKDYGDYFTINISSPNTPNLRNLQNEKFVKELFTKLCEQTKKPIFLKISPDMNIDIMLEVCESAVNNGASGIIATNTTIDYYVLKNSKNIGGISGLSLRKKSREILQILGENLFNRTTLISVGGIDNGDEAYERIKLGASLIQIYTGMVFEGPKICRNINETILERLKEDGFDNIKEAIGKGLH